MSFNDETIHNRYNHLAEGTCDSWDVYTGETAADMAQNEGIQARKWAMDTISMQTGQDIIRDILSQQPPHTATELEIKLRSLIHRIISVQLRPVSGILDRKVILSHALVASGCEVEENLPGLIRRELEDLQTTMENVAYNHTLLVVLPAIKQQCQLQSMEEYQVKQILDNAGALGTSVYLDSPELRIIPEVVGAGAELASRYAGQNVSNDICMRIALGLFVIAAIISVLLLSGGSSILTASTTYLPVESTITGIGAAIDEEINLCSCTVVGMLKAALGTSVLASVFAALQIVMNRDACKLTVRNDLISFLDVNA